MPLHHAPLRLSPLHALIWLLIPASALALPDQPSRQIKPVAAVTAAQLVEEGELDQARSLLHEALPHFPDNSYILFQLGMLSVAEQDYPAAIQRFRTILVNHPKATRVRLELGRALFNNGDDDDAERQFRFARSGDLPAEVNTHIDRYLAAIHQRRTFRWDASFAVAPDTNINAAPSIEEISIFGLPFRLSDDAKRQTGVGLTLNGSAEWTPHLTDTTRLRVGGTLSRTDYKGGEFDDTLANVWLGPNYRVGNTELSTLLTGTYRWYGNEPYNHALGIRQEVDYDLSSRTRFSTALEHQWVQHDSVTSLDGTRTDWTGQWQYTLTPSSGMMALVGVSRESTQLDILSNTIYRGGVGYYQELYRGISVLLQPEYLEAHYDAEIPAFGVERRDQLWRARLTLSNRQWVYHGYSPTLSFIHSERDSNIDLYSYDRNQFQLGVTRLY